MFPCAIPVQRADHPRVTHPSAASPAEAGFARLACLRRAASVRSEPGSNSPLLFPISKPKTDGYSSLFSPSCRSLTNSAFLIYLSSFELTEACRLPHSLSFPSLMLSKTKAVPGCPSNLAPFQAPVNSLRPPGALPSTEAVFCTLSTSL